ncbi:MAG: hypothetical protein ACRDT6_06470 [Micromonosporaceae bacterium]
MTEHRKRAGDMVAGKFAAHPAYRTAVVIGANRVCEPYWNRIEINTSIYSDAAAAAVIRRDHVPSVMISVASQLHAASGIGDGRIVYGRYCMFVTCWCAGEATQV